MKKIVLFLFVCCSVRGMDEGVNDRLKDHGEVALAVSEPAQSVDSSNDFLFKMCNRDILDYLEKIHTIGTVRDLRERDDELIRRGNYADRLTRDSYFEPLISWLQKLRKEHGATITIHDRWLMRSYFYVRLQTPGHYSIKDMRESLQAYMGLIREMKTRDVQRIVDTYEGTKRSSR